MTGQRSKGEVSTLESGIPLEDGDTQEEGQELKHYTMGDL